MGATPLMWLDLESLGARWVVDPNAALESVDLPAPVTKKVRANRSLLLSSSLNLRAFEPWKTRVPNAVYGRPSTTLQESGAKFVGLTGGVRGSTRKTGTPANGMRFDET